MADIQPKAGTPPQALSAVVLAVILWSVSAFTVRAAHAAALVFVTWRLWFAVPTLLGIVSLRDGDEPTDTVSGTRVPTRFESFGISLGAGALFAGGAVSAFAALNTTTLLDVALIGSLQPVLVIAFAVAFLGERVTRSHVARAAVAVAGTLLVVAASAGSSSGNWSLGGDLLAVLSLVVNTGWYLYGRWVRTRYEVGPFAFMYGALLAAAVLVTPVAFAVNGSLGMTEDQVGYAALTMVVGTGAHLLVVWAHRWVPASISSPLLLAQPPLIALGAWAFFGEAPGGLQILGAAIVLGALFGMVRSETYVEVDATAEDPEPPM